MPSTDPSGLREAALAFVRSIPWRSVLFDLAVVVVWFAAVSFTFRANGWPSEPYYVVLFGGVIGYSLVSKPWPSRRDR